MHVRTQTVLALGLASALACAFGGCASVTQPAAQPLRSRNPPLQLSVARLLQVADVLAAHGDSLRAAQYLALAARRGVSERRVLPRLLAVYARDGQVRLAIERASGYLRRHPDDQALRRCLAAFYSAIDAHAEAAHQYQLLVDSRPDDAEAHFALAAALQALGTEPARSDDEFRAYLTLAPRGDHAEQARAGLLKELP